MAEVKENIDKIHISLHLYDTNIAVTINRQDEENCRKAAKLITETINRYASQYNGRRELKEVTYMAMLEIAMRFENESQRNATEPIINVLSKITSEIEDVLK